MPIPITPSVDSLPPPWRRARDAHKGDFGRVLIIGGSRGMAGAVALAGMAALRSGAGLVKLAVPDSSLDVVAGFNPCYMTSSLPADRDGRISAASRATLAPLLAAADVVACGPGIGRSDELSALILELWETIAVPAVFDADALNALAMHKNLPKPAAPRIITPHPGEFSRLTGIPATATNNQRTAAHRWASQHQAIVVLKGHHSLITDGTQAVENRTGNPGLATGGSGDVLTGVIAAVVGQKLTPFAAAQLGVYLHGLAGDFAAGALGEISLTAHDVIDHLPAAWRAYQGD